MINIKFSFCPVFLLVNTVSHVRTRNLSRIFEKLSDLNY